MPDSVAMRDDHNPFRPPDGCVERLPLAVARPRPGLPSYAPVLPRLVRGAPALPPDRRARPRVELGLRGRLVDLVS